MSDYVTLVKEHSIPSLVIMSVSDIADNNLVNTYSTDKTQHNYKKTPNLEWSVV